VRFHREGAPLPLELPAKPSFTDGAFTIEASAALRLRFEQGEARRGPALVGLYLPPAGGSRLEVECEVEYAGAAAAWPVRFAAREVSEPVLLAVGSSGDTAATGWLDPRTGRGVDFSAVHPRLRLALEVNGSRMARTVRISGRIPGGREVVIFSSSPVARSGKWPRSDRLDLEKDAAWLSGWTLPGAAEAEKRARADSAKLRADHGAYLELGDGWQGRKGSGPFARSPRSWESVLSTASSPDARRSRADPSPASADAPGHDLASQLRRVRALGFAPGVWIVPHGQDESSVYERSPQAFITQEKLAVEGGGASSAAGKAAPGKRTPVGDRFLGKYVVDGTSAAGLGYLQELFKRLRGQGARVLRIGGLRETLDLYSRERESLADPGQEPLSALRATVAAMREGAGEDVWLLGDWDTPPELAGLLDGARPRLDPSLGVEPLRQELAAAAGSYRLHRWEWWQECFPVVSWSDAPSVVDRREQDRARLVFAALTGRGVIAERGEAPPAWVVEHLSLTGPPAPVRPLSLETVEGIPPIWVLKLDASEPRGDLVGLFNVSGLQAETVTLDPRKLGGTDAGAGFVLFDVLAEKLFGAGAGPWDVSLLPACSRLLWLVPEHGRPAILGLSTRLLAAADSFEDVRWDERRLELAGAVSAGAWQGDSSEARLHVYTAGHSIVGASSGAEPLQFDSSGLILTLRLKRPVRGAGIFRVLFAPPLAPREEAASKPAPPKDLRVSLCESERRPLLEWAHGANEPVAARRTQGFQVLRDGVPLGQTTIPSFLDVSARAGQSCVYSVAALPGGDAGPGTTFVLPAAREVFLDALSVVSFTQEQGFPARRRSVVGGPLSVAGRRFERGLGVRASSRLDYRLDGEFARLEVFLGVDDAARFRGSVEFVVIVDDKERHRSPVIRGGGRAPQQVIVPIAGCRILSLVVEDGKDGAEDDLADWCDARVIAE
jgi:alpha-galactosidase